LDKHPAEGTDLRRDVFLIKTATQVIAHRGGVVDTLGAQVEHAHTRLQLLVNGQVLRLG